VMRAEATVCCVDITHDWIFAGDFNGKVYKYQRGNCALDCDKQLHTKEVRSLTVARGYVFTASKDGTAKMSEIEDLSTIRTFQKREIAIGELQCIAVGIEFFFIGGKEHALRLSYEDEAAKATHIEPITGISHMALNGQSLFMSSKADDKGQVYLLRDSSFKTEGALTARLVFEANEKVRSLELGGSHLFVATRNCIYKLDARKPDGAALAGIDVTALDSPALSEVKGFAVYGEIIVVGYFPGSQELGIFHTKTCSRVSLEDGAFKNHTKPINCVAVG